MNFLFRLGPISKISPYINANNRKPEKKIKTLKVFWSQVYQIRDSELVFAKINLFFLGIVDTHNLSFSFSLSFFFFFFLTVVGVNSELHAN
jgi:hypothetical protein